ncbi:hypothetical protein HYW87_01335 [Candidatus Roizmanbacteria bacterium]|nr:hypothetical protein [Candidatus Roizmanbacteria bacterium]
MNKLLIATHNKAKLSEHLLGLAPLIRKGLNVVSLTDLAIKDSPQETGKTFEENSLLKAKFYGNLSGLPTISDDGGLIIPVLNNKPGVTSKRWPGYEASDKELIQYTLKRLEKVHDKKRVAYLQTCICFYDPETKKSMCEEEKIKGFIAKYPTHKHRKGYPFRALFIVEEFNKYYDELSEREHQKVNHRLIALRRLLQKIESYLIE